MLQRFVDDTGKDWDHWYPFVLFASGSISIHQFFSPFQLLYGWDVQGPLDLQRKSWEVPSTEVTEVWWSMWDEELACRYQEEVELKLPEAQRKQKM